MQLGGLDARRLRSHGFVDRCTGQTLGVVTPNEEGCAFRIVESLPCERLDVAAVVISQVPVRIVIGEFADALHPHVNERMDDCPVQAVGDTLKDGSATRRTTRGATWRRTASSRSANP
jgi:hypothetical protein